MEDHTIGITSLGERAPHSWGACPSSDCGRRNTGSYHCQYHTATLDIQHKTLYGGLGAEYCAHFHSLPHSSGMYNCPFAEHRLQMPNIQDCDIRPVAPQLYHLSNAGFSHLFCLFCQLQQIWQPLQGLVFFLLAYPSMLMRFWPSYHRGMEGLVSCVGCVVLPLSLPGLQGGLQCFRPDCACGLFQKSKAFSYFRYSTQSQWGLAQ